MESKIESLEKKLEIEKNKKQLIEEKKKIIEEKERIRKEKEEQKKEQKKEEDEKRKQKEKERKEKEEQKEKERKEKEEEKKKKKDEEEEKKALKELEKQEKELKKQKINQNINDKAETEYLKMKREVEKKWFFVKDLGKFAMFDDTRKKFIIHGEKSTILNLACYTIETITVFGPKQVPFYNKWIADPNRRQYDSIVFDPKFKNKNDFNTFTGFKYDNTENPKKSTKTIHKLLDHLLRPKYKKYILEWLSFIIKNKDKTDVAIVLYSHTHGVGKNSFIELVRKLIDEKYTSKLEKIEELSKEFTSFLESKFFIYGDEVKAKNIDLYTILKNSVTRSQVKINKKGIDEYELDNFVNWLFTTNNRVPFMIEKEDRRMTILECNEKKLSEELIKEFYGAIQDENIIKTFYHELLDMETPTKILCLDTPLKKEIQNSYLSSPIKYLLKNYKKLEGTKWTINELFEEIKKFEKTLGFTEIKSSNQMALILNDVGNFKYKNNDKRGYKFIDLENILKNYDEELFREFEIETEENI